MSERTKRLLQNTRAEEPRSPVEDALIDLCAELLLEVEALETRLASSERMMNVLWERSP